MIRNCYECDYCEALETKGGAHIHLCLDEDGAFLQEVGLCGYCGEPDDDDYDCSGLVED